MAITWDAVVAVAPELASASPATQAALITIASAQIDLDSWGSRADIGATYLAAHLGTLARQRGGGQVTTETVERMGRTYATPQGSLKSSLLLTSYGAEYDRLLRLNADVAFGFVP